MRNYTAEQIDWVVKHFTDYDDTQELLEAFNERFNADRTWSGMYQLCAKRLKLRYDDSYPREQNEWLIEHALDYTTVNDLAVAFKKRFNAERSVKSIVYHYGALSKKGLTPKRPGTTQYGKKPKEQLPVGTIRKSQTATYIKVLDVPENDKHRRSGYKPPWWQPLQYKIYTDEHGSLPPDKFVIFLDGNTENFSLDNLYPIDRQISAVMSSNNWWSDKPQKTLTAIKWCELHYTLKESTK